MSTQFRIMRAMALSAALLAPTTSFALADSPASLQAGPPAARQTAQVVVPNNGLCGAQYGVPMAECDEPHATQHAENGAAGGIDYQGFPYNLPSGG